MSLFIFDEFEIQNHIFICITFLRFGIAKHDFSHIELRCKLVKIASKFWVIRNKKKQKPNKQKTNKKNPEISIG